MIGVLWVIWGYYLSVGEVSALFWHIAVKGLWMARRKRKVIPTVRSSGKKSPLATSGLTIPSHVSFQQSASSPHLDRRSNLTWKVDWLGKYVTMMSHVGIGGGSAFRLQVSSGGQDCTSHVSTQRSESVFQRSLVWVSRLFCVDYFLRCCASDSSPVYHMRCRTK